MSQHRSREMSGEVACSTNPDESQGVRQSQKQPQAGITRAGLPAVLLRHRQDEQRRTSTVRISGSMMVRPIDGSG